MSLATQSVNGPWVCTVYYGIDKDMNLYIVTDPNSIHGKNIAKNPKVAFNIFDSRQKIINNKVGLQGGGKCQKVTGVVNVLKGLVYWQKANPGAEKLITLETIKKFTDTRIFKITPSYLKFFNKDLYTPEEYGIWEK